MSGKPPRHPNKPTAEVLNMTVKKVNKPIIKIKKSKSLSNLSELK